MVNEHLDDESISVDVTDSVLDLKILIREPDSVIEKFMVSTSHVKDENKIGRKHLSKV